MTEVLLWLETHQTPRRQGEADQVASRGQEEEEEEEEEEVVVEVEELVKTMVETSQGCLVSVVSLTVGFRHSRKLVKGEVALLVDDQTLKFLLRHQEVRNKSRQMKKNMLQIFTTYIRLKEPSPQMLVLCKHSCLVWFTSNEVGKHKRKKYKHFRLCVIQRVTIRW